MPTTLIAPPVCPSWCDRLPEDHTPTPDFGSAIHRHRVGPLGTEVEWCPTDRLDSSVPVVYTPDVDGQNNMSLTPSQARQLAAELITAADVLDSAVPA